MRIILKRHYIVYLFCIFVCNMNPAKLFCQACQKIIIEEDIKFGRLIGNNCDLCFIAAKESNGSFFIAHVNDLKKKIYLNSTEPRFIFSSDSNFLVLSTLKNRRSYSDVTAIEYYDRKGNLINKEFYNDKNGFLINVAFSNVTNSLYFTDMEMTKVNLYRYNEKKPIISVDHFQPAPPSRMQLPIFSVTNKIYIAFDNEYLIQVFTLNGDKLFHFTNNHYKHKPYTEEEIKLLPGMVRTLSKEGVHYPPAIKKIEAVANNIIVVTRHPRLGSKQVVADIFNNNGSFLHSNNYILKKNDKLEDVYSSKENYYCLVRNKELGKFKIYIFELKL